jgi:hypothetical protein
VHPRFGLVDSVTRMSAYEWNGPVFFDGRQILAKELPWWYAPDWLVIGSPLPTVLLAVLGGGLLVADLVRRRAPDLGTVLAGSLVVVPIAVVVALHATLYDSLRHVLFTVPGMILLGTVCLIRLWEAIRRRGHRLLAWVLVAAVLIGQADVAVQVARLRPLEYVYFSPVVGGFSAARRHYETDYWAACQTLALRWLTAHYRTYTAAPNPTVHGLTAAAYDGASPTVFRDAPANQDFLFADGDSAPAPGYTRIHEVRVEGVTVCTVNVARQP